MKVARWGNSLAIRIPAEIAAVLGLKEGDEVKITVRRGGHLEVENDSRAEQALRKLAKKIKVKLPPDWKFDREEIYEERMRELGW